jgi:hypothetical protein
MRPARMVVAAVLVVAVVFAYRLSPLTVWFAVAIVPGVFYSIRGLDARERQWVAAIVIAAIALRLLVIAGLFLSTDHSMVPFGSFFGDEDYFIKRSLWLRNVALHTPVHALDLEYAFEPYGRSSHLYLLAFVQVLVGPSPYGLRLLGVFFYVLAVLSLHRLARATLGRLPALFGLTILLFLPSLFAWSVSVLKEPLFVLISAFSLVLAVRLAGDSGWRDRGLALAGLVALAPVLESVRQNGALFIGFGVLVGLAIGFVARRPRVMLATLVAIPILLGAVFRNPAVQLKTYAAIQSAARQHWGAVVVSRGHDYRLLDARFYPDSDAISGMEFLETMRFLVRGVVAYVTVPLPWDAQSRTTVAYLPEQIIWYVLAALVPAGALFGFRRNAAVTGLLLGHALVIGAGAAFIDGNVGTLVRHHGLALPYLVWLSGVGACELLAAIAPGARPFHSPFGNLTEPLPGMRPA